MTSTHKKAKITNRRIKAESKRRRKPRYKHTCPKCKAKRNRWRIKRQKFLALKDKYGRHRAKEML